MSNYIELKENLLGGSRKLDVMADEVLGKLEDIDKLLEKISDYCKRIGTSQDSKTFRKELKDKIFTTTIELKEATDLVNKMDNVQVKNEEQKRNQITTLRKNCKEKLDKATKLIKKIEQLEKKNILEARMSVQNQGGRESFDQEMTTKQSKQIDIDYEICLERENDIIELTKLLAEMKALAELQAKYIKEQGEELVMIHENVQETQVHIGKAKRELEEAKLWKEKVVKSDTKCLMIAIIVCVVFVLLFLLSSNPESLDSDSTIIVSQNSTN